MCSFILPDLKGERTQGVGSSNPTFPLQIMNDIGPDLLNGGSVASEGVRRESLLLNVPHTEIAVDRNGVTRRRPRCGDDLQVLIKKQENEDICERMANEWRHVAQVIDRLLFWIFLVATTLITFVLLVLIPSLPRPSYEPYDTE
ncbi:unnamed protein product [Heligmosomoides polygyrus]|uniref:Neur_chan_memb domain-containing protein n=1 Tax=Heligmosomoides polygyrus TaxID=6339 RepID=A0A183GI07_HELPZ|nr:unnamed protein product [Heligmosomoides polygyrus]